MRWIKAAAAVAAIGALLVLPPMLLITYVGNPWPVGGISWNAPLTDGAIVGVLAVVVWILWAQLAACIVAELVAAVRRTDSVNVPLAFGFQRDLARWAVRSVLALAVLAPTVGFSSAAANAAPSATPAPVASMTQTPVPTVEAAPVTAEQTPVRTVVVEHLDNLYSIAQKHLGDGARWNEIADLNKGQTMNDGTTFTNPQVIRTGWELQIPDDGAKTGGAHVVEAGDSLSQIAAEELGDAEQWPAIYQANRDVVGSNPDLIFPGQRIVLPRATAQTPTPQDEAEKPAPTAEAPTSQAETPPPTSDVADHGTTQGDHQAEEDVPAAAGDREQTTPAPVETQQPDATPAAADAADEDGWPIRTAGGVGALLAAALVGLIALRRGRQQRRRPPGAALPLPGEQAETVETEVRAVADAIGLDTVDLALRQVAAAATAAGERLPDVRAARLTTEQLDLYLSEPGTLHAPWTATADPSVWVLTAEDAGDLEVDEQAEAPYPALISLGHDEEEGVILLNLASVGRLGLSGERAGEAFTAIALELGSAPWAAAAEVTVVGALAELTEALSVRYVPGMGAVDVDGSLLNELVNTTTARQRVVLAAESLTAGQYAVLADAGVAVVTRDSAEGEWVVDVVDRDHATVKPLDLPIAPQLVDAATYAGLLESLNVSLLDPREVAAEPAQVVPFDDAGDTDADSVESETGSEDLAEEEVVLVDELKEEGDVPSDAGELEEDQDIELVEVDGQHEDVEEDEEEVLEQPATVVVDEPVTATEIEPAYEVDPLLETGHPVIRLLGEKVDIIGAAEDAPGSASHRDVCTRIAAYLAMNPTTTKQALVNGVWGGRRISDASVDSRVSNLRKWLGAHPESGEKYLPPRQLRLNEAVTTDWHVFLQLVGKNPANASTENLEQALRLVRGRPLGGEDSRDYTFAEFELIDMHSLIADVAYHLARRRYFEGAWRLADKAAAAGVLIEPHWEPLWRLRLHIAHSEGRPGTVAETINRMHARISELAEDTLIELEPETVELIAALKVQDAGRIERYREAL